MPLALALGVAALGGWVGAQTLGMQLAATNLASATRLNGGSAQVLAARAAGLVEAGQLRAALAPAREALRRDPTAVAAVQAIGLNAQAAGDGAGADRALAFAERLSRRDLQTHLWAIERHVARGDTAAALREYDLALRASAPASDLLFPILGAAITDRAIAGGLAGRLTGAPIWRDAFLSFLARDPRIAPSTAVGFLEAARARRVRAPAADLAVLVNRSLDVRDPRIAWRAYMLENPSADAHRVRDPGFAAVSQDPTAFDWTLADEGGISAQGGTSGLTVAAGSGTAGSVAQQSQLLPPGSYRPVIVASRSNGGSLTVSLDCSNGAELARVAVPGGATRRVVGPPVLISPGCPMQVLRLAVDASDAAEGLDATIRRVELLPIAR